MGAKDTTQGNRAVDKTTRREWQRQRSRARGLGNGGSEWGSGGGGGEHNNQIKATTVVVEDSRHRWMVGRRGQDERVANNVSQLVGRQHNKRGGQMMQNN